MCRCFYLMSAFRFYFSHCHPMKLFGMCSASSFLSSSGIYLFWFTMWFFRSGIIKCLVIRSNVWSSIISSNVRLVIDTVCRSRGLNVWSAESVFFVLLASFAPLPLLLFGTGLVRIIEVLLRTRSWSMTWVFSHALDIFHGISLWRVSLSYSSLNNIFGIWFQEKHLVVGSRMLRNLLQISVLVGNFWCSLACITFVLPSVVDLLSLPSMQCNLITFC